MARYRLDICAIFDTEKSVSQQCKEAEALVVHGCPHNFNLCCPAECSMSDCWSCWFKALEEGVLHGCKSVHVRRLD